ncbi:MAG: hypothetical protein M0R73_04620 [Dehalococcoidia bacterium]|nr:hypothetical protein [Dehalococcoidia bacterium]
MLSMEVEPAHSLAHVRGEARRYFEEMLGMEPEPTTNSDSMMFTGDDGYVRIEFTDHAGPARVLLHSKEFEHELREFARIIA